MWRSNGEKVGVDMIISVASGKGGTGKTTIATSLALSLANVQFLDCDVEEPNAHIFLKPQIRKKISVGIPVPEVDQSKCNYCGKCAQVCEFNAIVVLKKKVLFFPELCHGCGGCSYICPERAIKETTREIGVIEKGTSKGIDFSHGVLNVGEPMAPPLIKQVKKLIGPGHVIMKMVSAALLLLIIFFSFAKGTYRVTAPTTLEGMVQRVVCAPFSGYIKEAPIRAGDIVNEGDVLCLLDERDLKLEHHKWSTQKEQFLKENREAMANRDRAQVQITKAKIDQANAQIALLNEQLVRTKILAPFHGMVMDGDLSQSLGAPIERGDVLFEVAPLDDYRVILDVDEREIDEIKVDQRGELVLPSVPGEVFPFTVKKITPVTTAKEGRNAFRVEARLDNTSQRLRPGMEGVGKISVCRCKLIWIWTHDMIDWVRLKAWSWWP